MVALRESSLLMILKQMPWLPSAVVSLAQLTLRYQSHGMKEWYHVYSCTCDHAYAIRMAIPRMSRCAGSV